HQSREEGGPGPRAVERWQDDRLDEQFGGARRRRDALALQGHPHRRTTGAPEGGGERQRDDRRPRSSGPETTGRRAPLLRFRGRRKGVVRVLLLLPLLPRPDARESAEVAAGLTPFRV